MTEGTKTGLFAVIAGVIALAAWMTTGRNVTNQADVKNLIGKTLFEKFTDPLEASSLKILKYDTSKEEYTEFEVSKDRTTGLWTIPSHESYPADANRQMADAATLFVGLKVIDVASERRTDQVLYGVVEPNLQKEAEGGDGVGMLVQLRDEKGSMLADVIIGKGADDTKRFVRIPAEDVIYVCELDPAPLTTDFKAWIEPDLLQVSGNDIETLGIRDYQIVPTNQGMALSRNYEADVNFSAANGQWTAGKITDYSTDTPSSRTVEANEQLNSTKLSEVRNTLDNLKIVDVAKKPAGLASDLKGDKSKLGEDAIVSLQKRGFVPNPNQKEGDVVDFYSKNGELLVTLRNGVQYLLRFGGSASTEINAETEAGSENSVSINPYLLVTVRLDESKYPEPVLEKVPESVDELKAIEALQSAANNPPQIPGDASDAPEAPNSETPEPESAKPETESETPKGEEAESKEDSQDPPADKPATEEPAKEEPAADEPADAPAESGDAQSGVSKPVPGKLVATTQDKEKEEPKAEAATEAEAKPAAETPAAPAAENQELTEEEWKERLEAVREQITKENARKVEERTEKLNAAKSKVNELNRRFADWYYVISEADYNKLKITLNQLIEPKGAAAPPGLPGAPGGLDLQGFPGLP